MTIVYYKSILLCFITVICFEANALAQAEINFRFHGGADFSYVNDRATLLQNGTFDLESHSPFPYLIEQNAVGTFHHSVAAYGSAPNQYQNLAAEAKSLFAQKRFAPAVTNDSVIGELSFKGSESKDGIVWPAGYFKASAKAELIYGQLKKSVTPFPVTAMILSCSRLVKRLDCELKNIGGQDMKTVDPLGMPGSVSCLTTAFKRTSLNPGDEYDPRKMKPKHIVIKAKDSFKFSIDDAGLCGDHILVSTSGLAINSGYRGDFLAEMISNKISR